MNPVLLTLLVCLALCPGQVITKESYKDAAKELRDTFTKLANDELGVQQMQDILDKKPFTSLPVDGFDQIKTLSSKLGKFFDTIFQSVKKIKTETEKLYMDNGFNGNFQRCCETEDSLLEFNSEFHKKTKNTLCYRRKDSNNNAALPYSTSLLKVMQDNLDSFRRLKWQYFGTEEGVFVTYPAHRDVQCNTYDPRFRPYYVEVLTPIPKDLVIVFDKSESMKNDNKLELSKAAAQTVVDTLNPNDRLALVLFSSEATTPPGTNKEPCYSNQMAYATPDVKQYFESYLATKIFPKGDTNYKNALQKAFKLLKTVENTQNRQKAIIFLTDGIPSQGTSESILNLLSSLNAEQNNRVLILTYSLGKDVKNGEKLLQDMANMTVYNNSAGDRIKGHFEHILHTTELRTKLGTYYNYFSGVDTLSSPIVTVPYTDFSGLGHIFSVCLPVKNSTHQLKGTTCIDIQLEDIRETYGFIEDDTVHAFIIDKTGRTLVHPLLPSPGLDAKADPLFVNIKELEPDAQDNGIIKDMKRLAVTSDKDIQNRTIQKSIEINRGNPLLDGVYSKKQTAHYYWTKIPGTHFSVCLVITENAQNLTITEENFANNVLYHLLNVSGKPPVDKTILCQHDRETVTKDDATVQFSKKAFNNPDVKIDDSDYMDKVMQYLNGNINGETLDIKPDIRTSLAMLTQMEPKWKTYFKAYISSKYAGTYHGIYQVFPGKQLDLNFVATETEWFIKAKANPQAHTLMASQKGVTITKALLKSRSSTHSAKDKVWGVMGMDVSVHFFRTLVNNQVNGCATGKYKCLIMDSNGYLLYNPDSKKNSNTHPIPISDAMPHISHSLKVKNILLPNDCTDYAWKKHYHTWKVKEFSPPVNNLRQYPQYFFTPIDNTNVYFIYTPVNTTQYLKCESCGTTYGFVSPKKCTDLGKCYCPCSTPAGYQHCLNEFKTDESFYKPCLKNKNITTSQSQLSADNLPQCYPYACKNIVGADQCGFYSECSWCHSNGEMNDMGCRPTTKCYFGPANPVTLKQTTDLVEILVPLFVLLALAVLVTVLVVYMYRKHINPFQKCFAPPVVKADNTYTDIPANNTRLNLRQPQQHPEGPYSISSPVGFMNFAYQAPDRHSIITGSGHSGGSLGHSGSSHGHSGGSHGHSGGSHGQTGGSVVYSGGSLGQAGGQISPEVRYVNRENGKIHQQPVLIIPVNINGSQVNGTGYNNGIIPVNLQGNQVNGPQLYAPGSDNLSPVNYQAPNANGPQLYAPGSNTQGNHVNGPRWTTPGTNNTISSVNLLGPQFNRPTNDNTLQQHPQAPLQEGTPYMFMNSTGVLGATPQMVTLQPADNHNTPQRHIRGIIYADSLQPSTLSTHSHSSDGYYEPVESPEPDLNPQPPDFPPPPPDFPPPPPDVPPPLPPLNQPRRSPTNVVPTDNFNTHQYSNNTLPRVQSPAQPPSEGSSSVSHQGASAQRLKDTGYLTTGVMLNNPPETNGVILDNPSNKSQYV